MARVEIIAKKCILFGAGLCLVHAPDQVIILRPDAAHVARHLELSGKDANGYAGPAQFASRTIGNVLGTAEAALGQKIIDLVRFVADQMRKDFSLHLTLKIGTRRRSCQKELRRLLRLMGHSISTKWLNLFALTRFPTQNRFALLLEMLWQNHHDTISKD